MLLHRRYINNLSKEEEPKIDYSTQYFTIESLEDNNQVSIGFEYEIISNINPIQCWYSDDNGVSWNILNNTSLGSLTIAKKVLSVGSKILIKSNYYEASVVPSRILFSSKRKVNVHGNVMSLCYTDNFINKELSIDFQFTDMFSYCSIVSAKNLILPINTTYFCYCRMFYGCTELIEAPALVADYLCDSCYIDMFTDCSKLKEIKILATQYDLFAHTEDIFGGWRDIAPNVTLYRKKEFSIMDDYVPSTWTIIDI